IYQLLNKEWSQYPGGTPNAKPDSQSASMSPLQWLATQNQLVTATVQNDSLAYARPLSNHPTGFMMAFCDGRVKFVSESISYGTYALLMTSNGKKYLPPGQATISANSPYLGVQVKQRAAISDGNY